MVESLLNVYLTKYETKFVLWSQVKKLASDKSWIDCADLFFIAKTIRLSCMAMKWLLKLCSDLCIMIHTCSVCKLGAKFCFFHTDLLLFEDQKLSPALFCLFLSVKLIASEGFFCVWQLMVLYSCVFIVTSVIQLALVSCLSCICSV